MNEQFVKLNQAARFYNVSPRTIYRWRDSGQLSFKQLPSGHFLYKIGSNPSVTYPCIKDSSVRVSSSSRFKYIYNRVSSRKQKDDLDRQVSFSTQHYPSHVVVTDIGSGLNFKRPGLRKLLKLVMSNSVEEIVITSKDRLCRFGFELVEWICSQHHTKLVVLDQDSNTEPESEFVRDILSIIQVYACKWNGRRRYTYQGEKNQVKINIESETVSQSME